MSPLDIAGWTIGVRELVLALIVVIAVYIAIVLWRMRHLAAGGKTTADKPVGKAEQIVPEIDAQPLPSPETPAMADDAFVGDGERMARELLASGMVSELALLREEVDALRGELAALREDMQQELAHLRATQTVSPIYGDAMQMAAAGYDAAMIAERCGIARAEAELVVALARSQVQ